MRGAYDIKARTLRFELPTNRNTHVSTQDKIKQKFEFMKLIDP
jgi:hypothetical protein